jgi:tRNA pseudouridine55 synthase
VSVKGILLVHKPADISSHGVVVRIRTLFHLKRVGHAGTLDPFATGLLILCLGEATKIAEYVADFEKEYVAVMKLGEATDTQDYTGQILETRPLPDFLQDGHNREVAMDRLRDMFARFVGEIAQITPMFSARKVQGRRLYNFARQGETVARAARQVNVRELELLEVAPPYIRFRVVCSKGTYIRTLAHDMGELLGCGAHLSALERTRIGRFVMQEAWTLDQLAQMTQPADRERAVIPLERVIDFLPAIEVNETAATLLLNGTPITLPPEDMHILTKAGELQAENQVWRVYNPAGTCIALVRGTRNDQQPTLRWKLQPFKFFVKT